jgi:hypothetical protein
MARIEGAAYCGGTGRHLSIPLQAVSIGPFALVAVPGETFSTLGVQIKRRWRPNAAKSLQKGLWNC